VTTNRLFRLRCAAGAAGPLFFTSMWLICSARQRGIGGYSVRVEHISGLAAPDALTPNLMRAGFVAAGGGTIAFASVLQDYLGGARSAGPGPLVLRVAGWAAAAAGVLHRDRMLLGPPSDDPDWNQSRRNDAHDLASGICYGAMVIAPLFLAPSFSQENNHSLSRTARAVSFSTASLLALFSSRVVERYNGILQRVAVSIPLVSMAAMSLRLWRGR
jgi:hypothetical protein